MPKSDHIISDGFTLPYLVEGEGMPALIIGSSLYYARTFSPALRHHLNMVFVDHRGFAPANHCKDKSKRNTKLQDIFFLYYMLQSLTIKPTTKQRKFIPRCMRLSIHKKQLTI